MKIKKGDNIILTSGKDKGRTGVVEKVFPEAETVMAPGLNEYKKHRKPMSAAGQDRPGEIVTLSRPIKVSNLAIVCHSCKLPTRVGFRMDGDKKIRICRKCQNDLDAKPIVKSTKVVKEKTKK